MGDPLRIIVTGLVGLYPVGGVAWDYLQYAIGLAWMGHDVFYYEDTRIWPYNPAEDQITADGSYSARFFADFFRRYAPDLSSHWHYFHINKDSFGMDRASFIDVARTADIFLNVSGACMLPDELSPHCIKIFLDTDPGYNQIMLSERFAWSKNIDKWCDSVAAHDQHFTYAENIHGVDCIVPKVGLQWKTTRMPIVLDLWKPVAGMPIRNEAPWTTVMTWNAFKGQLFHQGVEYKSKGCEFEKLMDLPGRVQAPLKVAVGGMGAPFDRLEQNGWQVVYGPSATLKPEQYQQFIGDSCGEISPAKHVYVAMRTGWFSCRSACYLASGRPVIVQDTGFSGILPTGKGLAPFTTVEEAVAGIEEIGADIALHSKAALEVAAECFDSTKVLSRMIEDL